VDIDPETGKALSITRISEEAEVEEK